MFASVSPSSRFLIIGCLLAAVVCFSQFGYIHAKALLAQWLIAQSWESTLAGESVSPWPWADTLPVARLLINNDEHYVLSGAHGTALAFGPGHVDGSALPGESGDSMIAGHRDTHFTGLRDVEWDDVIRVETPQGSSSFRVTDISIVDTREQSHHHLRTEGQPGLVLVTCYPFDAAPRGPLRLVVRADLETDPALIASK